MSRVPSCGGGLHGVDQFMFGIALQDCQFVSGLLSRSHKALLDLGQRGMSVALRFTAAQQIQVWPVQEKHFGHLRHRSQRMAASLTLFGAFVSS